jgi:hypothetical protein
VEVDGAYCSSALVCSGASLITIRFSVLRLVIQASAINLDSLQFVRAWRFVTTGHFVTVMNNGCYQLRCCRAGSFGLVSVSHPSHDPACRSPHVEAGSRGRTPIRGSWGICSYGTSATRSCSASS